MIDPRAPVATMVLEHAQCAAVLDRHRIDYASRDQRSLADACEVRGIQVDAIARELEAAEARPAYVSDLRTLTTRELITGVIARHHDDLRRRLPYAVQLAVKVGRSHGLRDPELAVMSILVERLAEVLHGHLIDQEQGLFPDLLSDPTSPRVRAELARMQDEHDEVGVRLAELRDVTGNYAVPATACVTHRTLLSELAALDTDTVHHLHLENHVLAPRFVEPALTQSHFPNG